MLCPRRCGVDRNACAGICGASTQMVVARIGLHQWEEPPISGTVGSGTVFFNGCTLKCSYCQNAEISRAYGGDIMSAAELASACLELQNEGALNINFVTPTHFAPEVRAAIYEAHKVGLHLPVVWNTSGYERVSALRDNTGLVDVYLTDMKYADADLAATLSAAPDYPDVAMAALEEMVRQTGPMRFDSYGADERLAKGVIVRHLVLPGHADDSLKVVRRVYERFGDTVRLSLMNQYTPTIVRAADSGSTTARRCLEHHPELRRTVNAEEYERVLDYADSLGIEDYYWQQEDAAGEHFIPDFRS